MQIEAAAAAAPRMNNFNISHASCLTQSFLIIIYRVFWYRQVYIYAIQHETDEDCLCCVFIDIHRIPFDMYVHTVGLMRWLLIVSCLLIVAFDIGVVNLSGTKRETPFSDFRWVITISKFIADVY